MPLHAATPQAPVLAQLSLSGKVAAVTGGARGIGLEVVRGLAEAGAAVALIYTSASSEAVARKAATEISNTNGVRIEIYRSDVRSKASITNTINQIRTDFGKLDICVANAGISNHYDSLDFTEEQYREIFRVNVDGAFFTAQAVGNIFKEQGFGSLIFTASVSASLVNVPQKQSVYNASKAAVLHLARSLAVEWVSFNARINCVSPGYIGTDMIDSLPKEWREKWTELVPAGRFCDPAELKSTYVFLAGDSCRYMTGADIIIDGGYTLL